MTDAPMLTITDAARDKILDARAGEPDADSLALWVDVSGVEGNSFTYDMYLRPVDEAGAEDAVQSDSNIPIVVPGESADKVRGSTLDLASGGMMVLRNPNSPSPARPVAAAEPPKDVSGLVAQRVLQVLDEQVNPAIAAHGGRADLVAVEGPVAYLHLSGGCQGCGMAAVTLRQGIEAMIFEAVSEITEVVDVTDHASGTNPYYKAD
jgi:Fe/S biogenesis protein NfuA